MRLTVALPLHTLSPAMQVVYDAAVAAAGTDASVLILGEEGSGKSVLAARSHSLSGRAEKALASLHMAGLSESLLMAELFGRGPDPDAPSANSQIGVLERARGSTIVLQQIGYAEHRIRERVFETMKTRSITRWGDGRPVPIDVRFIATLEVNPWNPDSEAKDAVAIAECRRHFDVTLAIPPLRKRQSEVPELALMFARWQRPDLKAEAIPAATMTLLQRYLWPGNLRELANVMQSAVLLSEGKEIGSEHLPEKLLQRAERP